MATSNMKLKAKDLLARSAHRILNDKDHKDSAVINTLDDPAFQHTAVIEKQEQDDDSSYGIVDRAKDSMHIVAETIVHPKRAAQHRSKTQAAGKVSDLQTPQTLPTNDEELLRAYDDNDAVSQRSAKVSLSDLELVENDKASNLLKKEKKLRLTELQDQRESMIVAWATQHVDRVKALPGARRNYPLKKDFYTLDSHGKMRFDHLTWLGHYALWYTQDYTAQYVDHFESLPFDAASLRDHTERLLIATAPWQDWLMDIRSVYRWENPYRTGRWLFVFIVLWYFNWLGAFFLGSLIFHTIRNKSDTLSMDRLRASLQRSSNKEGNVYSFGEFTDRFGHDDWVDPLLDQLGPYFQVQINDLANLFETLANFYAWRSVRGTWRTLANAFVLLVLAIFVDIRIIVKTTMLAAGGLFFISWPIASLYPQYRLLVSPFTWMLMSIPTHAEWSFDYLQSKCDESRTKMMLTQLAEKEASSEVKPQPLEQNIRHSRIDGQTEILSPIGISDPISLSALPILPTLPTEPTFLSYTAIHAATLGMLSLHSTHLTFTSRLRHNFIWSIPYNAIDEIRKFHASPTAAGKTDGDCAPTGKNANASKDLLRAMKDSGSEKILEVQVRDGSVYTVEVNGRDEVFNYLLGFAGRRWRSLQR